MWIDDDILTCCHQDMHTSIFVPDMTAIVLGSSNKAAVEVDEQAAREAGVPILKRYGGGGTVVLYPGCVVISLGTWVAHPFKNDFYFRHLNQAVIDSLAMAWPQAAELSQAGLSDIVMGPKKLAGTSLFRSKNYLLYQASLLVSLDLDLITRVLHQPSKEPDYRQGRSHGDFLMGLDQLANPQDRPITPQTVAAQLEQSFVTSLRGLLGEELLEPQEKQFKNLLKRAGKA